MKTITKETNLYRYSELSDKAQERARDQYIDITSDHVDDVVRESIGDAFVDEIETRGYEVGELKARYSLSYSQGDGVMFEGEISKPFDEFTFFIKHNNSLYCHEHTARITGEDEQGEDLRDEIIDAFEEDVYIPACLAAKRAGYDTYESYMSEISVMEYFEENDTWFDINGVIYENQHDTNRADNRRV